MVYDLHQHIWPPELIDALRARTTRPRLVDNHLQLPHGETTVDLSTHDLDARLAALDAAGVDVAVVSLPATLELDDDLVEIWHESVLGLVASSGGRLQALANASVREGFVGASLSALDMHALDALAPLLAELEQRGRYLFVHPGPMTEPPGAPAWWPAVVGYTAQMQAAYATWIAAGAERFPELRVLFAILAGGAPIQLERLASRGLDTRSVLHENVYLDTASYGDRALELALSTYGVGQLVYGSDWPVIDAHATLQSVRGFGQAVADAVCSENPAQLLR
jgi:predicted TIM-barrel fold metal-dependent hydrolase